MPKQTFSVDEFSSTDTPFRGGNENLGFELTEFHGGFSRGVQLVRLRCWDKSIDVLLTRGMSVWQASRNGVRFGWNSPISGPVHPQWVNLSEPSGLGWLDGFDELVVRCGLVSNGAPEFFDNGRLKYGLHGRIGNLPAQQVMVEIDEEAESISISGLVIEQRFLCYRWALHTTMTLRRSSPEIQMVDRVENQSDRKGSFQMLYHCNFGPPLLESGANFFAPVKKAAPRDETAARGFADWRTYREPEANFHEQVYFLELATDGLGDGWGLLANRNQSLGAYVRYAAENLPYFTLWKNTVGMRDGYVTGLEPGTNYPNPRGVEEAAGRDIKLAGGEVVEFKCAIGMLTDSAEVQQVRGRIEQIASGSGILG